LKKGEDMNKYFLCLVFTLSACSSTPRTAIDLDHIGDEKIIQTFGKDDSLKSAQPFRLDGHRYVSTGFTSIPGDHRPEAAIKLATASARAMIGKTISSRLEAFQQSTSEGTADSLQLREVITESSKLDTSEWQPGKVYYEKVKVVSESGVPRLEYRVWAEVTIDEDTFKHEVLDSLRNRQSKTKTSQAFQQAVDKNFNKLLGESSSDEKQRSITSEQPATE
jgi:hypothetical protein